mmetsp:Transcript_38219/g.83213  ORF Transcript_38219/g.83213 Transcript_38219/m.83213 type:complete len:101 (-) Transcript_38219:223-525(-)
MAAHPRATTMRKQMPQMAKLSCAEPTNEDHSSVRGKWKDMTANTDTKMSQGKNTAKKSAIKFHLLRRRCGIADFDPYCEAPAELSGQRGAVSGFKAAKEA